MMRNYYREREDEELNREAIYEITKVCLELMKKKYFLYRDITVNDINKFIEDVKNGKNGLGVHWSWISGKAIEGNDKDRYELDLKTKVLNPNAIDFVSSYGHNQIESQVNKDDQDYEITLKENGKIELYSIEVYDRKEDENYTIDFKNKPLIVKIREEY